MPPDLRPLDLLRDPDDLLPRDLADLDAPRLRDLPPLDFRLLLPLLDFPREELFEPRDFALFEPDAFEPDLFGPPDDFLPPDDLEADFFPPDDFLELDDLPPRADLLPPDLRPLDLPPPDFDDELPPFELEVDPPDPDDALPELWPAALPAIAPMTPPTTAPTGPATLPMIAPVAAPAVCFEIGGMERFSDDCELCDDWVFSSSAIGVSSEG